MRIKLLFLLFIASHLVSFGQSGSTCAEDLLNEKLGAALDSINNYQVNIKKYKTALFRIASYKKSADSLLGFVEKSSLSAEEQQVFKSLVRLAVNDSANDVSAKARTLDSKYVLAFNKLVPLVSLYDLDKEFNLENKAITDCKKWAAEVCKFATNTNIDYYNASRVKEADSSFEGEIRQYRLKHGDMIADIGTGSAYFERALAKYADNITVYSNEINAGMVAKLQTKLALLDLYDNKNITYAAVLGDARSAHLPKGKFDKIIIRNTFHHFSYPDEMLQDLKTNLKKGGKLYIVDIMMDEVSKAPQCPNHIAKAAQLEHMTENGFVLVRATPLSYDEFQLFEFDYK